MVNLWRKLVFTALVTFVAVPIRPQDADTVTMIKRHMFEQIVGR